MKEAIILAAGMGTRLKPLTLANHKCLTEVNGVAILENTLKILEQCGFKRVVLVVGYLKEQIMERVGDSFGTMEIVYAENDIYADTNTTYSLKAGLDKTKENSDIAVLEGDVFFEKQTLARLFGCAEENATILEKYNPDLDGTFVELDADDYVVDWTHKSQRTEGYTVEEKYKTVNLHKFSAAFVRQVLRVYLEDSISVSAGKEPMENVMMRIVRGHPRMVKGVVLSGEKWFEIDDLHDLELAEKIFR